MKTFTLCVTEYPRSLVLRVYGLPMYKLVIKTPKQGNVEKPNEYTKNT